MPKRRTPAPATALGTLPKSPRPQNQHLIPEPRIPEGQVSRMARVRAAPQTLDWFGNMTTEQRGELLGLVQRLAALSPEEHARLLKLVGGEDGA